MARASSSRVPPRRKIGCPNPRAGSTTTFATEYAGSSISLGVSVGAVLDALKVRLHDLVEHPLAVAHDQAADGAGSVEVLVIGVVEQHLGAVGVEVLRSQGVPQAEV